MSQVIEDGTTAVVHYTGSFPDGEVFDSSDGKDPLAYQVGKQHMIPGFEQEMIYYMEKFDINEEIIRLKSHLILFDESIKSKDPIGKKLGFICQEIGREINTLGSKANDAVLQKHVIEMKENLEKIKENILNIL